MEGQRGGTRPDHVLIALDYLFRKTGRLIADALKKAKPWDLTSIIGTFVSSKNSLAVNVAGIRSLAMSAQTAA